MQFALRANAHLIDDETVAKVGHPVLWRVKGFRSHPSLREGWGTRDRLPVRAKCGSFASLRMTRVS
jgi:hypothetical protein